MGETVIACYRPRTGQAAGLDQLLDEHLPTLRRLGLATGREVVTLRASDGSILEIFEWVSGEAAEQAHSHPEVRELWGRFAAACELVALDSLEESHRPFPHFTRREP